LLFLLIFLLLAWLSYKNVSAISKKRNRKILKRLFIFINGIVVFGFVYLYIYPNQPREATNIPVYFYFNAFLFTLFIFNIPNSLFFLIHILVDRKRHILSHAGLILSICLAASLIYGVLWGSHKIQTKQVDIEFENLPESFDDYKVLQFSDVHLGSMLKSNRLLNKANDIIQKQDPDLVLFTGDIVNNFAYEMNGFRNVLGKMATGRNSFSILGNHDYGNYTNWTSQAEKQANFEKIVSTLNETGFQLLRNEHTIIYKNNDSIFLAGVENWGHPPFPQYADLEKAIKGIPKNAFTILMTHDPAHWHSKVKNRGDIEFSLSGHTHGMQWGIKIAGIKFSIAALVNEVWGGLYKHNKSVLYVNTGLGNVGIPWRLDMAPEITVIKLKRSKVN
jgi:predicted MPP superfamily phosphohydrolase